jgi:hypothetical protein
VVCGSRTRSQMETKKLIRIRNPRARDGSTRRVKTGYGIHGTGIIGMCKTLDAEADTSRCDRMAISFLEGGTDADRPHIRPGDVVTVGERGQGTVVAVAPAPEQSEVWAVTVDLGNEELETFPMSALTLRTSADRSRPLTPIFLQLWGTGKYAGGRRCAEKRDTAARAGQRCGRTRRVSQSGRRGRFRFARRRTQWGVGACV